VSTHTPTPSPGFRRAARNLTASRRDSTGRRRRTGQGNRSGLIESVPSPELIEAEADGWIEKAGIAI
jgi:hypothetical protein